MKIEDNTKFTCNLWLLIKILISSGHGGGASPFRAGGGAWVYCTDMSLILLGIIVVWALKVSTTAATAAAGIKKIQKRLIAIIYNI